MLVRILTNLISDYQGTAAFNGINIKEIQPSDLYRQIIYLTQNDVLINDTVCSYLRLTAGRPELSEAEIRTCFEKLALDLDPDTLLDLNASNLSGGQKKKLQLAGLMLSDQEGKMIILDEAEAGLDEEMRKEYAEIINDIIDRKNAIAFIIQHSDSSMIHNKRIKVLQYARMIKSCGTGYARKRGHAGRICSCSVTDKPGMPMIWL